MPENTMPGPVCDLNSVRESVCIHTRKIFDSCRDKDCVEDLRFYPTAAAQEVLNSSQMLKGGTAELLYVYTDVEPVSFNRGFYSVDMRFYYRVTLQVCTGTPRYTEVEGLCVFDKRCILFGSEGNAKIFSSDTVLDELDVPGRMRTNLPVAVVEAVDPIVLSTRVAEIPLPSAGERGCLAEIPSFVAAHLRDAGAVYAGAAGAGHPTADPGVRLLRAPVRVQLRQPGGPLRAVPQRSVPHQRVLPAQFGGDALRLQRHQELLRLPLRE